MLNQDLIDEKINTLLDYKEEVLDETCGSDIMCYLEIRDFAEKHGGLLFFWDNNYYLVINFVGEKDFLIIPVDHYI